MRETLARGGAYAHQYRTRRRDGRYYWLEANGRVELTQGHPSTFPGVLIDIEGRRAVEAERDRALAALRTSTKTWSSACRNAPPLLEAEEALRQAQKMEAVGQLTGGLAHDFNNILAGISGSLELMKVRLAQGRIADIERHLNGAQSAVKRAAALTQRLLAFSRRQTLDPTPADLNRIVAGMHDLIGRSVGPAIAVETIAAGGLWNTFVDVGQLENALLNLCINARDAMPTAAGSPSRRPTAGSTTWPPPSAGRCRPVCLLVRERYRHRHVARCGGAGLRSLLHHQAHRAGTGLGLSMVLVLPASQVARYASIQSWAKAPPSASTCRAIPARAAATIRLARGTAARGAAGQQDHPGGG
jgi:hypothetical protein